MNGRKLFGTDGVRGTANQDPMTAEVATSIGMAAGHLFSVGGHRNSVVIGKDTRLSGYLIEPALTAGFISVGMDVILVGPIPTPGISMLTRSLRADLGVMISASHNPYHDNGIKLFGPDGYKLSDKVESKIEDLIDGSMSDCRVESDHLGRAIRLDDGAGRYRYIEYCKNTFPRGLRLDGLKIVIDCANGAAYKVAPAVLWELGAEVIKVGVTPDGFNINRGCGSLHTDLLQEHVVRHGADLGIALDGDADRVVICDETGSLLDGDQLLGVIAKYWQQSDQLRGGGIVATVMSNLGLERFLSGLDLKLMRTQVGDRYVVQCMRDGGYNLGGEQSGHIVMVDHATTGDGLIAALQVMATMLREDRAASESLRVFDPVPQFLKNVELARGVEAQNVLNDALVKEAIAEAERKFDGNGRLLIRESGTERVIRIMAEGDDRGVVSGAVAALADVIGTAAV